MSLNSTAVHRGFSPQLRCFEDDRFLVLEQSASSAELFEFDSQRRLVARPVPKHRSFCIKSRLATEDDVSFETRRFVAEDLTNQLDNPKVLLLFQGGRVDQVVGSADAVCQTYRPKKLGTWRKIGRSGAPLTFRQPKRTPPFRASLRRRQAPLSSLLESHVFCNAHT